MNSNDIQNITQSKDKINLIYFTASWCGPCKMMKPIIDSFISKNSDKVSITKIDVDSNREAALSYQINSVPTFMVFQDGILKKRFSGSVSQSKLEEILN